jgi:hypothetical protein
MKLETLKLFLLFLYLKKKKKKYFFLFFTDLLCKTNVRESSKRTSETVIARNKRYPCNKSAVNRG